MEVPLDRMWARSRLSLRGRLERWRGKGWVVGQCAVSAAVAWWIAADLLDHDAPFFAPIAAVVGLGTSYGQRHRRIAEITAGVAIGVLLADAFVAWMGSGAWQLGVVVLMSMSIALLLD